MKKTNYLSLALMALYSTLVSSADKLAVNDEILVTATRQPILLEDALPSAQVFTKEDIERLQPRDLPTLLGRMSGVDFRDSGGRGSTSGVFIRGAASSQSIILIDGVRTASATVGATALEGIPVESIERIELVKGPLSGLYGADAIGGVIHIFTKTGENQRFTPSLHLSYGTDDTQHYTAAISGGNQRGSIQGTFSYENSAGLDRTTIITGGNADRDGFDEFSLNIGAQYRLLDNLQARINILRTDAHGEFDNLFGTDNNFDSDTKIENSAFNLVYTPSQKLRLKFDASYFKDESNIPVFGSAITARRASVSFQSDYQLHENHTLTAGMDYYDDRVDTLSAFTETSRDNISGFGQWQGQYGKFSTVGTVRYDDNETYGDNINGSLAVKYALFDSLAAIVSYGTAFRAPSFNDLFFPGFGNPNVQPEESETVEISLKGLHFGNRWRVSVYHTDVQDLIGFDVLSFTANNTSEATLQGVEFETLFNYAGWTVNANLNYLDARDDTTDEYLDDRAKFAANVELYRGFGAFNLSLDLQTESGRHDNGGQRLDGFAIIGANLSYRVSKRLRFAAHLENLFNSDYTINLATGTDSFRTYGRMATVSVHASY